MTKRFPQPTTPVGWAHPRLWLHRALHSRRVLQYRARVAVIALVALLIAVIAFKLSPLWLLLAPVLALLPTPVREVASLRELEASGGAYTTALIAPPDEFGFQTRLESQALAQQKRSELPAYPWLEGLLAAALCSLLFVFPPQPSADGAGREIGNPSLERANDPTTPDAGSSSDAPPVLDAPSRNTAAPSSDGDAKPGQSASGGSPGDSNIGDLKPGGGNASEDPAAISREFMDALERGAVRDASSNDPPTGKPNQPQVQDNDAKAAQQGSAGGDQSGSSGSGSQEPNQNSPGQNGANQNKPNQNGQGNQSQQGAQNPSSSGNQGNGTQGDGQNGQQGNQPPDSSNQSGTRNGTRPGQSGQRNGRGNTPNPDEGQSGDGQGQGNRDNSNPSTTARGARGSSDPQAAERPTAPSGKLEYLPGTLRGTQVRSGALQLPGDPRAPLTGTPGTPAYKRAAEGAVLDPKLPPEYQELLKNYYR